MNVGDIIIKEPTDKGVILRDKDGDYWAYGRIDGMQHDCWEIFCADPAAARHYSERAETTPNGRYWDRAMRYDPLTVVELGEAAASPRFILGQAVTDLSVYKQFVRDKVISEAERRGWCDEVDGWLKELGLEPRPVKLPEGIGSTVHLKDDQGVAIRVLPPSSEKEWQWVHIMASGDTSSARTSWVQQHAATVNSDRGMMA